MLIYRRRGFGVRRGGRAFIPHGRKGLIMLRVLEVVPVLLLPSVIIGS